MNYGHLARLLPVAQRLKADGETVLVAVRDLHAASVVLGPAGIPFVQAPHLPQGLPLDHRAAGYSDILLSQGWADRAALSGLVHGWLNLFQLFRPDRLLLDYSPTVSLAARIARISPVLVGNGFELPPVTDPLPPFPGFSWATADAAANSERRAVDNANGILRMFQGPQLCALSEIFTDARRLYATFPELDHYGARPDARYIGPLLGKLKAPKVDWPAGEGPKIFACLRPDTNHVQEILAALAQIPARVVCVASGFTPAQLQPHAMKHIRFSLLPVDFQPLLDADLCISYGAEGTTMRFLMAGVPQLIAPWHVEAYMSGRRIEAARLGAILPETCDERNIAETAQRMAGDCNSRAWLGSFANHSKRFDSDRAVSSVVRESLERVAFGSASTVSMGGQCSRKTAHVTS